MSNRNHLKNVAAGILGSFVSRNNDIGGYWAMGKLCRHAKLNETKAILIDVLNQTISPDSPDFGEMLGTYFQFLRSHLDKQEISQESVTAASVEVVFDPEDGKKMPATIGVPFKVTVSIRDDLDRVHTVSERGSCRPHNPRKESKSARA